MPHDGPCVPFPTPHKKDMCVKCGRHIVTEPAPGERDIGFEWEFTQAAASMVHLDGTPLNEFAASRAGTEPIRDFTERDMVREVREELGDARNYLTWLVQQLHGHPDAEQAGLAQEAAGRALAHVVAGWHEVEMVQQALDD